MPDSQPTGIPAEDEIHTQRLVLGLIANQDQKPWSLEDIVRTLSDATTTLAIEDALSQLRVVGLINRADQLYFASQAAAHVDRLKMLEL
jgi:hypothetical protein